MAKVTIQLLTYNGAKYIPYLFDSLRQQTFQDWELMILDNDSTDDTLNTLRREVVGLEDRVRIEQNEQNVGFARGHNQLFTMGTGQYILILNQDVYLEPGCIERLVAYLDEDSAAIGASPRLMKWHFAHMQEQQADAGLDMDQFFGKQVDALGFRVFRSGRVVELGSGALWSELEHVYGNEPFPVFGFPATCGLYRRSALADAAYGPDQLFDSSYGAYKEDVDLAYRLQESGWKTVVVPCALAYHDRSSAGARNLSDAAAAKNKKKHTTQIKHHSYANHLKTLYKHMRLVWILDIPFILWYEMKKFAWYVLFDRTVLLGLKEVFSERKELRKKRRVAHDMARVSPVQVRDWWAKKQIVERSYGVIPIYDDHGIQVLVVKHAAGHWSFPKGHQERNESPIETALRELKEETALSCAHIGEEFFYTRYTLTSWRSVRHKTVGYVFGVVQDKAVTIDEKEIVDVQWLPVSDAYNILTHTGDKNILERVFSEQHTV